MSNGVPRHGAAAQPVNTAVLLEDDTDHTTC